ncbi:hypothetical protein NKH19_23200 [Mesorhizobium sp. M1338]|uniref:hypothetical protein n=1 Tax=unclassified Mesorhizobium TaxID=325217 RepID=UPI003339611B
MKIYPSRVSEPQRVLDSQIESWRASTPADGIVMVLEHEDRVWLMAKLARQAGLVAGNPDGFSMIRRWNNTSFCKFGSASKE